MSTGNISIKIAESELTTQLGLTAVHVSVNEHRKIVIFTRKNLEKVLRSGLRFISTDVLNLLCQDSIAAMVRIRQCQIQAQPQHPNRYVPCAACGGHGVFKLACGDEYRVGDLTEALAVVFILHSVKVLTTDEGVALLQQALDLGLRLEQPTAEETLKRMFNRDKRPN